MPVEIEARIGYLGERSTFISGVPEHVFYHMTRILSAERALLVQPDSIETDYIYERPDDGNYRVTAVGDGPAQRVINAGTKTKRNDLIVNGLQADTHFVTRLSVSTESEDEEKPTQIAHNWTTSRHKTRSTFTNSGAVTLPNSPPAVVPWRIDLTRVSTTRAMRLEAVQLDAPVITYEIELEMPPLLEDPSTSVRAKVLSFYDGISLLSCALGYANRRQDGPIRWVPPSSLIHKETTPAPPTAAPSQAPQKPVLDPNRHPDFPTLPLEKVFNAAGLRPFFDRCFSGHPQYDAPNRFVGTMPINFARRHIFRVKKEPYYISEKTDGVRFLLHITRGSLSDSTSNTGPSAYLIDRSNSYFKVPGLADFAALISPKGDTLLDGEMVKRHDQDGYYFLLFDAIMCDGACVWNLPLDERLAQILMFVGRFESYRQSSASKSLSFAIYAKEIMSKEQFKTIRSRIEDHGSETLYRSPNLCHLTDGLIFMPDGPYPLFTCQSMFKWKFVDRQTIDFELTLRGDASSSVDMFVGGNGGTTVLTRTTNLSVDDMTRLRADVKHSLRPNLIVAEMGFEPAIGLWRYHKLRPDKDKANYISIAMDTMESIAESITLSEVERELQE